MSRLSRWFSWRPAVAVLLAGSIGLGAAWLGQHQPLGTAQAQTEPPASTTNVTDVDPTARKVSAKPAGVITAIATDPTGFTFRTPTGQEQTVRVVDGTVFKAGPAHPYSFSLLKIGDQVRVKAPALSQKKLGGKKAGAGKQSGAQPKKAGAEGRQRAPARAEDGTPIARQVVVRPAEGKVGGQGGKKAGQSDGQKRKKNGGLDDGAQQ